MEVFSKKISCPHRGQHFEVDKGFAGRSVECSSCGREFTITAPEPTKRCPMCGEEILAVAKKCKHCGEYLDDSNQPVQKKSRAMFILLALFFGGLGIHNFYIGRNTTGFWEALIGVIGFGIFGICIFNGIPYNLGSLMLGALTLWILLEIFTTTQDAAGNPLN